MLGKIKAAAAGIDLKGAADAAKEKATKIAAVTKETSDLLAQKATSSASEAYGKAKERISGDTPREAWDKSLDAFSEALLMAHDGDLEALDPALAAVEKVRQANPYT